MWFALRVVSPEATVVVILDHDTPRMWVPLTNLPLHEYTLLTLSSKVYSGEKYCEPLMPLACIGGYVESK